MLNIIFLGLVSFFTDISSEMVYPLIPLYLVSSFGATPALVGVVEGIAESLASLLKVFSGYVTDRFQQKKATAFMGYAAGIVYKLALLFAGSWLGILGARVIDRVGKGIRTAPRDVLVSESVEQDKLGKAFGLHKAMDMLGAAIGILITYFVLRNMGSNFEYKKMFSLSIIPAVLGLLMFFFIKQKKNPRPAKTKELFWVNARKIDSQLKLYLFVVFLFTLGNSSNTFILLKAQAAGFDTVSVILLYFLYNITASVLSMPFGKLSDCVGRKKLLVPGYLAFSLCYLGFAFASERWMMVAVFAVYGAYTAMIAGVERAYVAEIAPPELKGTMLGLQSTVSGVALLPASVIAGFLWNAFGSAVPFVFGAVLSLAAALILLVFMKNRANA
ncbi:MAG: MFS transporter [Oscillospiraceae bacterium]|nr:MFS transporter [Oscillospiraceae bacterium]